MRCNLFVNQTKSGPDMSLVKLSLIILPFQRYFDIKGRSSRLEFWTFAIFVFVFSNAIYFTERALSLHLTYHGLGILSGVFAVITFIPSLSVSIRRLHDRNKSGWWFLLVFLPVIGFIWLHVLFLLKGDQVANRFGDRPTL